jgi:hypothetical protein
MSKLNPSGFETHSTGTINKNGILNGNWERLNALLNPDLSDTNPLYGSLYGVLEQAVNGQRGLTVITYASAIEVRMDGRRMQKVTLAGNLQIDVDAEKAGREVVLFIVGDGSSRTLTFAASYRWGGPAITTVPANKIMRLTISCLGTAASEVILTATIEA